MTEETARDEDFARRFEDEARPGARVDPPNVVRIHAFGAGTTGATIVYELIEGESLASVLERGPRVTRRRSPRWNGGACR